MATHIGPHNSDLFADSRIVLDPQDELFYIMRPNMVPCDCTCPRCPGAFQEGMRKHDMHTRGINRVHGAAEPDDLIEIMEAIQESYDEDYDRYQEEHHHEIVQMERYEMWRNEY
jgi:hypothetical protein